MVYHRDRAVAEQLRGVLAYRRNVGDIYQDMLDEWLPQGPHIALSKYYGGKRIRGPHRRAEKRKKVKR